MSEKTCGEKSKQTRRRGDAEILKSHAKFRSPASQETRFLRDTDISLLSSQETEFLIPLFCHSGIFPRIYGITAKVKSTFQPGLTEER